ncbi:MAG: ankyrin repeat domain-containing protein, partial [Gammaproteobacteria bacterium]|nr:ankyrin repeat domain-containing protein [Gammaproteobacteria bacterium]
ARIPEKEFKSYIDQLKQNRIKQLEKAKKIICSEIKTEYGITLNPATLWSTDLPSQHIQKLLFLDQTSDDNNYLNNTLRATISKKINTQIKKYEKANDSLEFEIPHFFEGIDAYFLSRRYLKLFPRSIAVDNQHFLQTLPLFAPQKLNPRDILRLDTILGIYTKKDLEFYFTSLYAAFEKFTGQVAFEMENTVHEMGFFYDPNMSPLWILIDPNQIPSRYVPKQDLTRRVLSGYLSERVLALHLNVYIHKKHYISALSCLEQWKKHPQWQAMHAITPARAKMIDSRGATWLTMAVSHNKIPLTKALLEAKANPEHKKDNKMLPLYVAAQKGYIEMIQLLRKYGASIEAFSGESESSSLHIAAKQGELMTVKFLLREKMNVNIENKLGQIPLHDAATTNRLTILNLLLEAKGNIHKVSADNESVLFFAAINGSSCIVKVLIDKKANLDVATKKGATPVYAAAQNGHTNVVSILANAKANLELKYNNKTPLMIAIEKGHADVIKLLLEGNFGYDKNMRLEYNHTLLTEAIQKGQVNGAKALIEMGADVNLLNSFGMNALYYAVDKNFYDIVVMLLKAKANPNILSVFDKTPLDIAVKENYTHIARELLRAGAIITPSALLSAVKNNHLELIKLLITYNADGDLQVEQNLSFLRNEIKKHSSETILRFEEFLLKKSMDSNYTILISANEMATIMGNASIIHSLKRAKYDSVINCGFWQKNNTYILEKDQKEYVNTFKHSRVS